MIALRPAGSGSALRVLCVGAHSDDIEIGCAGALLQVQRFHPRSRIDWVVLTGSADRQRETSQAMRQLIAPARRGKLVFGGFRDTCLPASYAELKDFFANLKLPDPDVVFCHERTDAHQDHRVTNEMVWGAFRDHLILEYEIPKWDGGLTTPNFYVPLTAAQARRKVALLMRVFGSQRSRAWFTAQTFEALLRLRGIECRASSGLAEGFHARKLTFLAG
jgi:LmbE family N-acetylglucosaminyl deacetylase